MPNRIDLTGQRFGRLTVIEFSHSKNGIAFWKCVCDCGNERIIRTHSLRQGDTVSCGCYVKEKTGKMARERATHGKSKTRLYHIFAGIKNRCYSTNNWAYKNYGGRGIKVCDEWLNDNMAFYDWAMANGYKDDLTIDRIDVNGDYKPSNCRWITRSEQANNKTTNKFYDVNGKKMNIKQIADMLNLSYKCVQNRFKRGWTVNQVIRGYKKEKIVKIKRQPIRYKVGEEFLTLTEISKKYNIKLKTLYSRIFQYKWDISKAIMGGGKRWR